MSEDHYLVDREPEPEPRRPVVINEQTVYMVAALGATLLGLAFICSVTVIALWGKFQPW